MAASSNDVIGRDGAIPWHLPEDLKRFRRLTMGKPVLMGRATYDAIGRPLPGRRNIVITRQRNLGIAGCEVVGGPAEALERVAGSGEAMIIGGGQVYERFLPRADRIHLTRVHLTLEGDAFFPKLDPGEWRVVSEERHPATAGRPIAYTWQTFTRL